MIGFAGPRLPLHFSVCDLKDVQILIWGKSSLAAELFSEGTDVECDHVHLKQQRRSESGSWLSENTLTLVVESFQKFLFHSEHFLSKSWSWRCPGDGPFQVFICTVTEFTLSLCTFRAGSQTCLETDEWSARRSKQHKVGVRSICGIPGDRVRTPLAGLSFSYSLPVNPPPVSPPNLWAGEKTSVLLSTWPILQERVSKVTSQQTPGPLKHVWVAPAVPEATADRTHLQMASNVGILAKTMFSLSERWNSVCLRGFL